MSSGQQEDGYSLDIQERDCRQYAADHGLDVAEVYREVHTGVELWERPALTRLRAAIQRQQIDAAIFHTLDRFSRDPVHQQIVMMEAAYNGVAVYCALEAIDDTDTGKLIQYIKGWKAKQEWTDLKRRTQSGRRARVESGKPLVAGRPLYGYQWNHDKTKLLIDTITGPVVQRIYQDAADGAPLRGIAARLTHDGVPSPTGKAHWNASTIAGMLHHPNYTGEAYGWGWSKSTSTFNPSVAIRLAGDAVPALVDSDTWHIVQARLGKNKGQSPRNNPQPEDTLLRAGFAKCAYCGCSIRVQRGRGGDGTPRLLYVCSRRSKIGNTCPAPAIVAHRLDASVWQRTATILQTPEIIEHELARLLEHDPTCDDLAAVDRTLAEVERKQRNTAQAVTALDDPDAAAPLLVELRTLSDRKRQLTDERTAILARRFNWETATNKLADITLRCRSVAANVETLTYAQKRDALVALGVSVAVYKQGHSPRFVCTASIPLGDDDIVSSLTSRFGTSPTAC